MRQRSFFVCCLTILISSAGFSQNSSVTNADLQVYREKRLKAEREYRENYQQMGFPSPEELDRRREQSMKETEELSAKLRSERLRRESIETQQRLAEQAAAAYYQYFPSTGDNVIYSGSWNYPYYGRRRPFRIGTTYQTGYFAGGHFWPGGLGTPPVPSGRRTPAPVFIRPRH